MEIIIKNMESTPITWTEIKEAVKDGKALDFVFNIGSIK